MERRVGARPVESPFNSTRYATRERLRTLADALRTQRNDVW